jgi:hypothetical protein
MSTDRSPAGPATTKTTLLNDVGLATTGNAAERTFLQRCREGLGRTV